MGKRGLSKQENGLVVEWIGYLPSTNMNQLRYFTKWCQNL